VLDEVEEEVAALGFPQVERDGLLVAGVHGPEEVMSVEFGLPPRTQRVGGTWGFYLHDLGTHVAEQPACERPGDQRADLDDPDAIERTGHIPLVAALLPAGHIPLVAALLPAGHAHRENPCRRSHSVHISTACRSVSR
jgi:hypothetical protein